MPTPHKHAALIHAWADGAQIQWFRVADRQWIDVFDPNWYPPTEYRIKPQTVRYRRYLYKSANNKLWVTIHSEDVLSVDTTESQHGFVRWIDTEWQEVEV